MKPESTEPVSDRLLQISAKCLSLRDLAGCRKYALEALHFDPKISGADQILAVADILRASDRRVGNNHRDWYSILKLRRYESVDPQLVWSQFQKLIALVHPNKNKFAFSKEAFHLVCDAWAVLSSPMKKTQYENEIGNGQEPQDQESSGIGKNAKASVGVESFWTVCPYCYYIYEYEKVYEDCCLRCQNCRKPFHGVAITAPLPEIMVPGKEQYYFCYGLFRLKLNGSMEKDKEVSDKKGGEFSNGVLEGSDQKVVEISDDDEEGDNDNISLNASFGNGKQGKNGESGNGDVDGPCKGWVKSEGKIGNGFEKQESGRGSELRNDEKRRKRMVKAPARRMMNRKAIASNTNKIMGNRRIGGWDPNENNGGCGVVFYEGEDDVFVDLEDIPC
ncbi:uncharacterized protein LOC112492609 [Ziziphus jujuba]|uniref:Uncharacterized protein LOC112492609 n=1 Tax=Ziziphus jujuba TaxID=326968 RepID=A0A6P6GEF9_ZIZJJ|nr:uncharacterized protein LOC112492609 [Ziziphus jujuba]